MALALVSGDRHAASSAPEVDRRRAIGPTAIVIDASNELVRTLVDGPASQLEDASVLRDALDQLRRRGAQVAVLDSARVAGDLGLRHRTEMVLGPVDVWSVVDGPGGLAAGATSAAQALGVSAGSCLVVTADRVLFGASLRAGMRAVSTGWPHGPATQGIVDRAVAVRALSGVFVRGASGLGCDRHPASVDRPPSAAILQDAG